MSHSNSRIWFEKMERLAKTTYIPVTYNGDDSNDHETDSKFGGIPFISSKHSWPVCCCGKRMKFFLQLNSDQLPSKLNKCDVFGEGLLQFFYCIFEDCSPTTPSYMPFSSSHKVRVIRKDELNERDTDFKMDNEDTFDFRPIINWEEAIDYPNLDEFIEIENIDSDKYDELADLYGAFSCKSGEKLLGYPSWIQNIEYPNCPSCNKRMSYIFQVDSESNIPYMFGDCGAGHITQCKDHRDQITFSWACC